MSHFKESVINLGDVKRHTSKIVVFKALPTIPAIIDISGCGCFKFKWNPETRELQVTYKAGEIPNQVSGNQPIRKEILVSYKGSTSEILLVQGTKIR